MTATLPSLRMMKALCLAGLILLITACATPGGATDPRDPWEGWNRGVFDVNQAIDQNAIGPFIEGYRAVVPGGVREKVSNVVLNLREPLTFANELLQGKIGDAGTTLGRFLINSTLGIGGLVNLAGEFGIPRTTEDFGQTLGVWGIGDGPYMVLPFFGPSNIRDTTGLVISAFADPAQIGLDALDVEGLVAIQVGVDSIDTRSRLHTTIQQLYEETDPYVFARSAYFQQRRFAICDGRCETDSEEEDLFDALEDELENDK